MLSPHLQRGQRGEDAAAHFLEQQGWTLRERNWRAGSYELDLVCQEKKTLVFVEVKTRKNSQRGHSGDALSLAKKRSLIRAARAYLGQYNMWASACRFDMIFVLDESTLKLEHIRDVISLSDIMGSGDPAWQPW